MAYMEGSQGEEKAACNYITHVESLEHSIGKGNPGQVCSIPMEKLHVVFIAFPGIGNLVPAVEFARHLTNHDSRLSATVLMIDSSDRPIVHAYIQSCMATYVDINFINLPPASNPPSPEQYNTPLGYLCLLIEANKSHVKNAITM